MGSSGVDVELLQRLPAFLKLGKRLKGGVPFVGQTTLSDCGAACLTMVLQYYGKDVELSDCRQYLDPGRDGTNAFQILHAGRALGLRGRGIKIDSVDDLRYLPTGAILHWRFMHFVVFEGVGRKVIRLVDPAFGRRAVSRQEFDEGFTGVALILEPGSSFDREPLADHENSSVLRKYVNRIVESRLLRPIIATSLWLQLLTLALPVVFAVFTNRVVPNADNSLLAVVASGAACMVLFHFVSSLVRSHLLVQLRTKVDAEVTTDFLEHLVDLPFEFFQRRSVGDLLMRLEANATIRDILTSNMLSGLLDGAMVILYLGLIFLMDLSMGSIVLFLAVARGVLYVSTQRRSRELMAQSLQVRADASAYEVQMLAGMETLKASGTEARAVEHWSNLFVRTLNVSMAQGTLDAWMQSILETMQIGSPLVVLTYGVYRVVSGDMSLGAALAIYALAVSALQPLSQLVGNAFHLQKLGGYLDRIGEIFRVPAEQSRDASLSATTLRGGITLERVSYRYDRHGAQVVKDVSITVEPGQFVAIVGASGSGKSTLAKLIAGLYKPESGRISYDGTDLFKFNLRALRQQIGVVPQHAHLFSGSIRENIGLRDSSIAMTRIIAAAKRSQIHADITAMPMGYDTVLADGGGALSGGQRQRLALARALVNSPSVLLLDEATSALDAVTEAAVFRELEALHCTRVVIAHRLSTIRNANLIMVLDAGQCIERGTYAELLRHGGAFARLVDGQLGGGPPR